MLFVTTVYSLLMILLSMTGVGHRPKIDFVEST